LLPGARADDVVEFTIDFLDATNRLPISNVQAGDEFLVQVSVDNIQLFANPDGVASAFLDLLYTDELVAVLNTDTSDAFPFDISFGPLFSGAGALQVGSAAIPGVIDEVGGIQQITNLQEHSGPTELFTVAFQAVSPGVVLFTGDPADDSFSETTVLGSDVALTVNQLRFGSGQLVIAPSSDNFPTAIDDSFPDGRDSDGNLISSASVNRNRLDVLANDNFGPTGAISEFGLVTAPTLGNVLIDDNGTPSNLNDDFLTYQANVNANGLEQFTYVIVSADGIRSTAEVTFPVGNNLANATVAISHALVDADGNPITDGQVNVGDRIGIQVLVEDLRPTSTFVFAGFLDMLYNSGVIQPADTISGDNLDFDVVIGPGYSNSAAVGTAVRPGIIDEFGTLFAQATVPNNDFSGLNPGLLAT
ncbi:MAG: Ig-like domain-containing protein, partial [Pirellulales bacterium]|nr:Ig-like domain-containing protein [Pirellulales bacterium]